MRPRPKTRERTTMAESSEPGRNLMSTAVKQHFFGVYKCLGSEGGWVSGRTKRGFPSQFDLSGGLLAARLQV